MRVGPEKFGILAVDSSKPRFAVLLTNFLGGELWADLAVENTTPSLEALVREVETCCQDHGIEDLVVAIERTGRYHVPIRNALRTHWDIRMVHPFATKQLRQPVNPGQKTDLTDLRAIVRAMMVGYGTREEDLPEAWADWRELNRERECLVSKRARLRVQIQERIEGLMPGFSALFADLWSVPGAQELAEHYGSAAALRERGEQGLREWLKARGRRMRRDTLGRILQWAATASPPDRNPDLRRRMLAKQFELVRAVQAQILAYECDLASYLAQRPFVLLLSIQGIGVVSAAGYGAELGPIENYIHPRKIRGRAGLYPSRYQSDETDLADGPLVSQRNARLRDAILEIAHNLVTRNLYFKDWAAFRRCKGWSAKKAHIAVANKFTRISYAMVAGRSLFDHPCVGGHDAILRKLLNFARGHELSPETTRDLLAQAARWMPQPAVRQEAAALRETLSGRSAGRRRTARGGPAQRLGEVLKPLLDRLAAGLPPDDERSTPTATTTPDPRTPH